MENNIKNLAKYGKFTVEVREKLLENYWKEIPHFYQHSQVLMSILGLIAGFGFTAYQYIKSPFMFFLGETFVVGSVFYLLYNLKLHIAGQPISTEKIINDYQEKARKIKESILLKNEKDIELLSKEFDDNVNDTSVFIPIENAKNLNISLENSFWFSIVGIILIFLSFFCMHSIVYFLLSFLH